MTKQIVAWQYTNTISQDKIEQLELFAEMLEATFDISANDDSQAIEFLNIEDEMKISIFFEQDEFFNKQAVEAELLKVTGDNIELTPIYEHDWEAECVSSFPALQIARFYIHSFDEQAPEGLIDLKIPAKMAFGTGEHATTKGCLALYDNLIEQGYKFKNGLDMGCGSAILAMCAHKADSTKFLGVDIDEPSVQIANDNLKENEIEGEIEIMHGDGFNDSKVKTQAPYDIIFANILKNPLLAMAEDLVSTLDNGGIAILSGFKEVDQKDEILAKYVNQLGLTLVNEFNEDSWSAVALKKA